MQNHAWPGNVRELKNVIERAVLLFEGDRIESEHLSLGDLGGTGSNTTLGEVEDAIAGGIPDNGIDFDLITTALRQSDYNQSLAARLLGISRDKLRYKIKGLGLTVGAKESDSPT